uniref:Putative secreted protein n=1 Tax=Anopheles marajoara TaxID=58244 RepID=A0A2M4CEH1_9DIPT
MLANAGTAAAAAASAAAAAPAAVAASSLTSNSNCHTPCSSPFTCAIFHFHLSVILKCNARASMLSTDYV